MKIAELRGLSLIDLNTKLVSLKQEQLLCRCNQAFSKIGNVLLIRRGRRNIARVATVINEKMRAA